MTSFHYALLGFNVAIFLNFCLNFILSHMQKRSIKRLEKEMRDAYMEAVRASQRPPAPVLKMTKKEDEN